MVNVQRVNGRLVRVPENRNNQSILQQRLAQRRVVLQNTLQIKNEANRIDSLFLKNNFGGSINEFVKQYNYIQKTNPEVAKALKFNPRTIQEELKSRISTLEQLQKRATQRGRDAKKKDNYVNKKKYYAQARGYNEGITKLKRGEIISVEDITSYAKGLGSVARRKARQKERIKKAQEKALAKVQPQPTTKTKTFRTLTNVPEFINFKSKIYLDSSSQKRKEVFKDLKEKYGSSIATGVAELASLRETAKSFSEEDYISISEKIGNRKANLTTADNPTIKLLVNEKIKYHNKYSTLKGDFKPLDLAKDVNAFIKENTRLDKFYLKQKKILKDFAKKGAEDYLTEKFSPQSLDYIKNKVLTKQTLSPQEQTILLNNYTKKNLKTDVKSFGKGVGEGLKGVFADPIVGSFNYGKNLVLRAKAGEKNPLYNDVKSFGKGVGVGLKEVFADPIVGSFNYGRGLVKRAEKEGTSAQKILRTDLKKIAEGLKYTKDEFKKDPRAFTFLVGAAVASGMELGLAEFKKNPFFSAGRAIAWFAPDKALKILKVDKGINKIRTIMYSPKYSKNTFTITQNLTEGIAGLKGTKKTKSVARIKGEIKGALKNKKKFSTKYSLNYDVKNKKVTGKVTYQIGKNKPVVTEVKFVEEAGYFVDLKTGEKLGKLGLPISSQSIKLSETKLIPKTRKAVTQGDVSVVRENYDVITTITRILNTVKKTTRKSSELTLYVDPKNQKILRGFATQLAKEVKKGSSKKNLGMSQKKIEYLEGFLKSIQYDKNILGGLDKRTRLARALGLRKDDPSLKAFELVFNKKGKFIKKPTGSAIIRKGIARYKGVLKTGTKPKKKDLKIQFRKAGSLRKNKKGNYSVVQGDSITIQKPLKSGKIQSTKFKIPELKAPLPTSKLKLKELRILTAYKVLQESLKTLQKISLNPSQKDLKKAKELILQITQAIKQINVTLQKRPRLQLTEQKKTQKTSLKTKLVSRGKRIPKTPKPLKFRFTPPKPPPPKIKLDLNLNSKLPRGQRLAFDIKFRERKYISKPAGKKNPVVVKTMKLGLPLNKAIQKGFGAVDKTTQASAELVISGITKAKDFPKAKVSPLEKKFRITKSKDKKRLRFVEKNKNRIDTKGEKKGLALSRALKPKKRKKKNIKKK